MSFLVKKPKDVPATTSAPTVVHSLTSQLQVIPTTSLLTTKPHQDPQSTLTTVSVSTPARSPSMPEPPQTPSALRRLQSLILLLPDNVPMPGPDDLLAVFSGDPESIHDDPSMATQDLWEEILNQKMHVFLGKTDTDLESLV